MGPEGRLLRLDRILVGQRFLSSVKLLWICDGAWASGNGAWASGLAVNPPYCISAGSSAWIPFVFSSKLANIARYYRITNPTSVQARLLSAVYIYIYPSS